MFSNNKPCLPNEATVDISKQLNGLLVDDAFNFSTEALVFYVVLWGFYVPMNYIHK
jgi:hypothetical protein